MHVFSRIAMGNSRTFRRLLLLPLLAVIPIVPYILLGYTGQDLPFHVCSWLDLRDGWLHGRFNPGWASASNYGLGDPHLTFYPPFSYFSGALLTLILPLKLAPAVFAYLALVLSGVAMYVASKSFVAQQDRLVAALLYMLGPYTITTSLIRFAAAELLVQAWLPLIALYFYQAVWVPGTPQTSRARLRSILLLALLLGLSWITNIPASIVLLYSLTIAACLCALLRRSVKPLLGMFAVHSIAAGLAAFYLVPVWKERVWIHPNTLLRINPLQLLLFMPHYNFNDSPLLVVCWIFLCVETMLVLACLRKRTSPLSNNPALPLWICLAAASFVLQSPLSIPLWRHAPELRFVQFPLRFLSLMGVALPLLLLSPGTRLSRRKPAYLMLGALSLLPFIGYLSEQAVASNRTPPITTQLAAWQRKGAPEYLPAATLMPVGPSDLSDVGVVDQSNRPVTDSACRAELQEQSSSQRKILTLSAAPCRVRLRLYFYPYWRATDEQGESLPIARDPSGLILINIPPGTHTVWLNFRPQSLSRRISAFISLFTLLNILGVLAHQRLQARLQARLTPQIAR